MNRVEPVEYLKDYEIELIRDFFLRVNMEGIDNVETALIYFTEGRSTDENFTGYVSVARNTRTQNE